MTLSVDPAPKLNGYVILDNDIVVEFGKISLKEIKLLRDKYKIDRVLIEVTDWPVPMAGESYRDTNIVIGRLIEFYKNVITIGRAEARNHFGLKNDSEVIKFLREKGLKLKADSWQAYLIYHYYESI